jgi:ATP-binding cassette subfamily C protein CydC
VGCAATGVLWYLQPSAALLLLTGLFLCGVALPLTVLQLARKTSVRQITVRTALQRHLVDSVAGMEDMLALGVEQERQDEYSRMTNEFTRLQRRQALIGASHQFLSYLLTWATVAGFMIDSIPRIQTGEFSGLLLAAAAFGVLASFEAVQPLPAAYQYLEQATEASRRIHEMISRHADVLNPAKPIRAPVRPSFAFRNVSFTFPGGIGPALSDISFDLPFGSRIAILGPNGAGKSTIVQLLCRFFDPQKGAVLLGKRSLADYSIDDVRAQLAVVLQRPHIFSTSIRENLRLARPVATDRNMMSALEKAGLASFVQSLPQGLSAAPGSEGLTLSGGQRQRLALAQAFLKDAPVLVLDEATANLDLETEKEILDRVFQFTIDRTLVVITHRPENLSGMDTVLTLREGCLQELGAEVIGKR